MSEQPPDVDTASLEEELDHSQRLIDEAKAAAEELAEANPDPNRAESPENEPDGIEPSGGTRQS